MSGLTGWLAWKGLAGAPRETAAKLVVGLVTTLLVLTGCALFPTALNRSERVAQAQLPVTIRDAREAGVLVRQYDDFFDGNQIEVVLVSVVGPAPRTYRGLPLPATGEVTASPQVRRDIDANPALRDRYPGTYVGTVSDDLLLGPSSRTVWVGTEVSRMPSDAGWLRASAQGSTYNRDIAQAVPDALSYAIPVLVLGFVLPLLALAGLLSSLGGRRREARLAALRLLGLRARSARWSGALQEGMVSTLGAALGVLVFAGLAPVVAPRVPAGGGVWPDDVEVAWPAAPLLVACLPLVATVAAWVGLRRAGQSPLSVERDLAPVRVTRPWALALLLAGVAGIVVSFVPSVPEARASALLLGSTGVAALGLTASLPVAVAVLAPRLRTASLPSMLAAGKLAHDPVRSTRVASGLTMMVLASGLLLLFFPLISAVDSNEFEDAGAAFGDQTLIGQLPPTDDRAEAVARDAAWRRLDTDQATYLRVHQLAARPVGRRDMLLNVLLVDCSELAATTGFPERSCARGVVLDPALVKPAATLRFVVERETAQGQVVERAVGDPLPVSSAVAGTQALETLESVIDSGAALLAPVRLAPSDELLEAPATILARPRAGMLEQTRTALQSELATPTLTFRENYEISTHTTRQFRGILWTAAALITIICGLSVLTAAYDQLRSSRPERRLLAVAGCRSRVTMSSLIRQMLTPVVLGVMAAGVLTVAIAGGFVVLSPNSLVVVPLGGIVATCVLAIVSPVAACLLALTLESREELLRSPE